MTAMFTGAVHVTKLIPDILKIWKLNLFFVFAYKEIKVIVTFKFLLHPDTSWCLALKMYVKSLLTLFLVCEVLSLCCLYCVLCLYQVDHIFTFTLIGSSVLCLDLFFERGILLEVCGLDVVVGAPNHWTLHLPYSYHTINTRKKYEKWVKKKTQKKKRKKKVRGIK